jgi:hypothetical protein
MVGTFRITRRRAARSAAVCGLAAGLLAGPVLPAAPVSAATPMDTHVFDIGALPVQAFMEIAGFPLPLFGNFAGSGFDDVFDWAPGSDNIDRLAISNGDRTFTNVRQSVKGSYTPVVGNFGGDAHDDILWYAPGSAADSLWISLGDGTFSKRGEQVQGDYTPFAGDFGGTGRDSIFWYGVGTAADSLWTFSPSGSHTSRGESVNGVYFPIVVDIADGSDGHHGEDIVWQSVFVQQMSSYWVSTNTGFASTNLALPQFTDGRVLVGDFGGDAHDDLFVYQPGSAPDSLRFGSPTGLVSGPAVTVNGNYNPGVGNWDGNGRDDIFWGSQAGGPDNVWFGTGSGTFTKLGAVRDLPAGDSQFPIVAQTDFSQPRGQFDFADASGTATDDAVLVTAQTIGPDPHDGDESGAILYGLAAA